ncbi:hypothetical protein AAG906_020026 [Vitis piasezkii]
MPNWIRDSGGRLVKLETPHTKELELSLNIMEATPEDQHSHHGHQDNPNEFRSMRDRMHPPRMSAPSCIDKAKIWLNSLRPRTMTRRLEELELKKMHEVQAVAETPVQVKLCPICQSYEHLMEECPTIPAVREMFGDQANVVGQFRPNNNAPYGNTYNSSWRNHPNFSWKARAPQYQPQPSQQSSSLEQAIVNLKEDNLQYSISRLTNLNTKQEKGRFTSQPHQNPKGIHEVETYEENLHRGLNVNKKAFLTEQVSAIIQCKSPLKYKDPGCPTISVMIGGKVVEKALLDLGASVNLLPYSVYKQLGLGELKPTSITLSLADRSRKFQGVIEDVLVQVDNFYYPVDFVVLDTDPIKGS